MLRCCPFFVFNAAVALPSAWNSLGTPEEYELKFDIPFPVYSNITEGTVEYQIWATSGRGDYRDMDKRLVAGPGTITIEYGDGVNPDEVAINQYEAVIMAAPLADGSSKTFISLIDGETYRIDQGEEFAAYWDFGYYYTNTDGATLASTSIYEEVFPYVDVDGIAGTTELNNCYFAESDKDFASIESGSDLNDVTTSTSQSINNLSVDDVVGFEDNYGNKGVIKVMEIVEGDGSAAYIKLDIKVQK